MNKVFFGDVLKVLPDLAAQGVQVQMGVTSPPYWGLRDYGVPPSEWPEITFAPIAGLPPVTVPAWTGCLGLEPDPWMFVAHIVEVFRRFLPLLADDGTLWVNMGDGYATGGKGGGGAYMNERGKKEWGPRAGLNGWRSAPAGLKHKDLMGMPWRVAFALQADGWVLRKDNIWHKLNPMPESATDRTTTAHEYVFHLSKSPKYFYDAEAVKEPVTYHGNNSGVGFGHGYDTEFRGRKKRDSFRRENSKRAEPIPGQAAGTHRADRKESEYNTSTRNKRSVWTIATEAYPGAHFATFPARLISPCILAGTSQAGHCPVCGARWQRVVEREFVPQYDAKADRGVRCADGQKPMDASNGWGASPRGVTKTSTMGWKPGCECGADPVPDVVMDMFFGSGTTGEEAQRLGRHWIGVELQRAYEPLQAERTRQQGFAL